MTTEEFIVKARAVHGDKYDYSKVEIAGHDDKVCIVCHQHGSFYKTIHNHLRGQGCPVCKKEDHATAFNFIVKAKLEHGDEYDYSKVEYKNARTKICIICPKHGEFWQNPLDHLRGSKCPICAGRKPFDIDEFIVRARYIHGNYYDYSKVQYKGTKNKVCIICPKHGEFWQGAFEHLHGHRCPQCARESNKKEPKFNQESFIEEAKKVHGGYYLYDKTKYVNLVTKICVTCPIHGDFWVLPYIHLKGHKCRQCAPLTRKKYTKEMCVEKALLCDSRHEFEIKYNGYYNSARYNGWYEECVKHMPARTKIGYRCIYAYLFQESDKLTYVYVGLTYNLEERNRRHHKEGAVYEFTQTHGIKCYVPIQLTDYLAEDQASAKEGEWLEYYIQKGYIPLNKIKTGSLGGQKKLDYSIHAIEDSLKSSTSFTEWREGCSAYYEYVRSHHLDSLLDAYYPDRMRQIYDNYEECLKAFSTCATLSEVKKRFPGAYAAAHRHKWKKELYALCNPSHVKWTLTRCQEVVSSCKDLMELRTKYNGAYQTIKKNGWQHLLINLKRNVHPRYVFTEEDIKRICHNYQSRAELNKEHPEIVSYCLHKKIDLFNLTGWRNPRLRAVKQIRDGIVIAIHPSTIAAAAIVNGNRKRLWTCMKQHRPYKGYMWEYID